MKQVSNKKIIKELDSEELVEYVENIWKNTFKKNTALMLACVYANQTFKNKEEVDEIKLCIECYKQMTGKNILTNMSDEFNTDYEKINKNTNDIKTA